MSTYPVEPYRRLSPDVDACRGCQACLLGCALAHEGSAAPALARLAVDKDMATYTFSITLCRHCVEPACLAACPTGAMALDERGVVLLDDELCVRCGACQAACPYGAVFYLAGSDRYIKCDLCAGRESGPVCAALCPTRAIRTVGAEAAP